MQLDLGMGKPAASIFHFSVHSVDFRNVLTLLFGDRQGPLINFQFPKFFGGLEGDPV